MGALLSSDKISTEPTPSTASKDIITKPSDEGTTGSLMPRPQRESLLISSHNDNRYGLIPQCELNEACPDSDHSKPAGISLKEHVYGIKPVFAKHPQARGTETAGTAFYVGMGYFLTCAHNVAWIGSSAQPQKRDTRRTIFIAIPPLCYEKDAVSKEKRIEVDFVGSAFLDDFKDEGKFYIDDIESPTDRDLAVVKVRPEDMHLFDNIPILKPAYLNMSSPTGIALSAINGACDYTDDEVERYQGEFVPSKDDFEKAVRRLKPGHVTEWMTKSFKSIPNASGDTAYVAFQISTTPGSSGSLLSQDGRLVAVHVCGPETPINETSANKGVLIGTKKARDFLRVALEDLIEVDPEWREFIGPADSEVKPDQPVTSRFFGWIPGLGHSRG